MFSKELIIFFIAAIPFLELQSAIPLALTYYKMHWLEAFLLTVSGNILAIIPFYFLLEFLAKYFKKYVFFNKLSAWFMEYKNRKGVLTEKYEILGLMIFIAVPLPLTGVWFGCLIAFILGMKFKYAFYAMTLGSIISGTIILSVIKLGYLRAVIAAAALIGITAAGLHKFMIEKKIDKTEV